MGVLRRAALALATSILARSRLPVQKVADRTTAADTPRGRAPMPAAQHLRATAD
ncbi:MAG: hypothetical protein M3021_00355 [Actinomycetota bacterium]|nr:hypothetical protein [Actinomycetota bacterium]